MRKTFWAISLACWVSQLNIGLTVQPARTTANTSTGTPQGLDGSHNFIEADSSNTREDLYVTGNVHSLVLSQFNEWMATSADGTFTMDLLAQRADTRFKETVAENPYFYYGPFTGMVARNAGFIFPGRLFANFSSENPDGSLSKSDITHSSEASTE